MKELYVSKPSEVHILNFWTKSFCFLLLIPAAAFLAPAAMLPLVLTVFLTILWLSRIPLASFWGGVRMYYAVLSAAVVVLAMLFNQGALVSRFMQGCIYALRLAVLVGLGLLYAMVTSPIEIPIGLLQARLPQKLGITVMVGFRLVPVIANRFDNVVSAQRVRGAKFAFSLAHPERFIVQVLSLIVPISYLSLEVATNLADALLARGYNPSGRITVPPALFGRNDVFALCVCASLVVAAILGPRLGAQVLGAAPVWG